MMTVLGCSKHQQTHSNQQTSTTDAASLQVFRQGDVYGYRDMVGSVVINPQYAEAGDFSWGLARVKPNAKGGWGYIDASGNEIIRPQYEAAGDFVDGMAVVLSKGQFMYIGPDGTPMGPFEENHPSHPLAVGDTLYVIHPSGLIMRASNDLRATPISQVRRGDRVLCATDKLARRSESVGGLKGTWVCVRYKGNTGYLIDLYLSRYPQELEHQPVERYQLAGSTLRNEDYSVYMLTRFATGGMTIVHTGPNWTESQEMVPQATVDQVVARLKLEPPGEIESLVSTFDGQSRTYTTEKGDTVSVRGRLDSSGFLQNLSLSRHNEDFMFDATISKFNSEDVEVSSTMSTPPSDQNNE